MAFSLARLRLPDFTSREWRFLKTIVDDTKRRVPDAARKPDPASWPDDRVTAAWVGHSTVLINFYGVNILTDPVLGARVGIHVAGPFVLGMKRYVAPALTFRELPPIDLVLLSHAHMDHFDLRTLRKFDRRPLVVTAQGTGDLLRCTRLGRHVTELAWGGATTLKFSRTPAASAVGNGELEIEAFEVRHWGARMRTDDHRGYNGYILRRDGKAILFGGDTSFTPKFRLLRGHESYDLAIMPIGAYDPWINSHCTPEQAVEMADMAGARFILPVHHQTFRLSREPFDEPIRRFERALVNAANRLPVRWVARRASWRISVCL